MKYLLSLMIVVVCSMAAFTSFPAGYQVSGTVTGLPDGTWLYLRTAKPDKDIDSCQLMKGAFSMRGSIAEKAVQVYLHTAKYTNYVSFWLENTSISVTVKAGEFKKGTITGSATQDEDQRLDLLRQPVDKQTDSLNKLTEATKDTEARKSLIAQVRALEEQGKQIEKEYVKQHPNSLIAANLLNIYASAWGKETARVLYDHLSSEMKGTSYGREISEFIALNKHIAVGGKYADFEQANTAGKMIKLSQVKGKYILLDFWASWCGPCREENPELVKTYARFKDKGFAVLGVSLDENKAYWLEAVAKDQLTWENVSDLRGDKNRAALVYGIYAIPNNFLIDEHGIIVAKNLRGKRLDDQLQQLLP